MSEQAIDVTDADGGKDSPPASEPTPDPVLVEAVETAREAASEEAGTAVGEHLGFVADAANVLSHSFIADLPGYRGWHWAVTLTRVPDSAAVTVDEVVLLPGAQALLAPEWVPWSERVRPGDLGAGDLLPADPDDFRLTPAYAADPDDDQVSSVATELGLGRVRVLSREGRLDAADRWLAGPGGPEEAMARHAPGHCGTCGFLVGVAGSLRAAFGICANEFSGADGRVVSVEFGCGAHSEAAVVVAARVESPSPVFDDEDLLIETSAPQESAVGNSDAALGVVFADEQQPEATESGPADAGPEPDVMVGETEMLPAPSADDRGDGPEHGSDEHDPVRVDR